MYGAKLETEILVIVLFPIIAKFALPRIAVSYYKKSAFITLQDMYIRIICAQLGITGWVFCFFAEK